MVYLDYNATAPYSPKVVQYIQNDMVEDWANASSEYDLGHRLSIRTQQDRKTIADFLDCSTAKIFFTSGATESINSVLSLKNFQQLGLGGLIASPLEHGAVLNCRQQLASEGIKILNVEHDIFGNINLDGLASLCEENQNSLVSLTAVNNETGVISPMKEIVKIAHRFDCPVHMDGVQALGKCPFSIEELEVDFASFSGHKIGALKGIGLLYVKNISQFKPLILGGGQERGFRGGTYNTPSIHGLKLSIEDIDFQKNNIIKKHRDFFESEFLKIDQSFEINAHDAPRVFNTSNIHLNGYSSREAMLRLASKKIFVSTGSACSSGSVRTSHVIKAIRGKEVAESSLRVSLGSDTSKSDMVTLLGALKRILNEQNPAVRVSLSGNRGKPRGREGNSRSRF